MSLHVPLYPACKSCGGVVERGRCSACDHPHQTKLSISQAARYLGWTPRKLREVRRIAVRERQGDPAERIGGQLLFIEGDLDELATWWAGQGSA